MAKKGETGLMPQKKPRVFHSMAEVEAQFLPQTVEKRRQEKTLGETEDTTLDELIARAKPKRPRTPKGGVRLRKETP